jgi:hypothetical protein
MQKPLNRGCVGDKRAVSVGLSRFVAAHLGSDPALLVLGRSDGAPRFIGHRPGSRLAMATCAADVGSSMAEPDAISGLEAGGLQARV